MTRFPLALVAGVALGFVGCSATGAPTAQPTPAQASVAASQGALAKRAAHTMTALPGGDLLVAGGCDLDGCTTATNSTFLVSGASSTPVADLADARDAHTAVALADGRVLVVGGFSGEGRPPLASAELFDPRTNRWTATGPLRLGRGGHAAALLGDGRVLVAGGWVAPSTYTDTTEIYDPKSGEFTAGPRLPLPADGLAAASLPNGCVLAFGGQRRSQVATDQAIEICPDGRSRKVGSLGTGRFKHGVTVLESGEVLVIGGTTDDQTLLASTELYDPIARRFRPGPDLLAGRYKLTDSVVTLPGGRVVVAGGGEGVELIDISTGTASTIGQLAGGRRSFSTVGVTHGQLVVLGGYDESIRLTETYLVLPVAEL